MAIDELLAAARAGRGGAMVLCGEPGIGKTTLLEYAAGKAHDMRILSARGYETESEAPFAGLADLLRPVLSLLPSLPEPQAAALRSALALGPPVAGDRFSVCAATVSILAAAADAAPTLIVVDDLQWLDAASKEAVLFAGRRLPADAVALLLAVRGTDEDAVGLQLPWLRLSGLTRGEADELCDAVLPSASDTVRERLYAATAGNPLGVIELAGAWRVRPAEGDVTAPTMPPGSRIERALGARLADLPERARQALLIGAAGEGADVGVVLSAAQLCGLGLADFAPAEAARLVTINDRRIEFRHPLLRSVLYHAAPTDARCTAHRALAAVLADAPGDAAADARAWHLAAATLAPDEDVARLLEEAAVRARNKAGYVSAARAFGHAARLSRGDPRLRRLLRAARCWILAGCNAEALDLLDQALPLADDVSQRALIQHLSGYVRLWRGRPDEVLRFLVEGAEQVEEADPGRAALMYLDANVAYFMLGRTDPLRRAARRAFELGRRAGGLAQLVSTVAMAGGLALDRQRDDAVGLLRGCAEELARANPLTHAQPLCHAALTWIWLDGYDEAERLVDRVVAGARRVGALGVLPQILGIAADLYFRTGRWADARACAAECVRLAEETRQANVYGLFFAARIDAVQGRDDECTRTVARATETAARLGVDCVALYTGHALGLLALGQGDLKKAIAHLEAVRELTFARELRNPAIVPWVFDLVEAYIRDGRTRDAQVLLDEQEPHDPAELWASAAAARCRALLAGPDEMIELFTKALHAGIRVGLPFEWARTALCLGERLRRTRQRMPARAHLHQALETFERLAAPAWADRARLELRATGETVRRGSDAMVNLTPQEVQVALLVGRGASNHEAAAALFLSRKTIEYHLSNIYRKTNIRSRAELAGVAG
jgi:DNA-binding NarL/FixJ family response regulator